MGTLVVQTTGATDNWMDEGNATTNRGTSVVFYSQLFSAGRRLRELMKFDISRIPKWSSVSTATLQLTKGQLSGTRMAASFFSILAANSAWTGSGSTWNTKDGTNNWAGSAGCNTADTDYNSTAIGSYADASGEWASPVDITLTAAAVKAWLLGNYGMLVKADDEATTATMNTWHSTERATESERPKLTVVFTGVKKSNGVALASIKKIGGVANASLWGIERVGV